MVMTGELEAMGTSMFDNIVPANWEAVAYPSLMALGDWVTDLCDRMAFINKWIKEGVPNIFWISGFFLPSSFLNWNKTELRKEKPDSYRYTRVRIPHDERVDRGA